MRTSVNCADSHHPLYHKAKDFAILVAVRAVPASGPCTVGVPTLRPLRSVGRQGRRGGHGLRLPSTSLFARPLGCYARTLLGR